MSSGSKDCPNCKRVNTTSAQRCDCGYGWSTLRREVPYLEAADYAAEERRRFPRRSALIVLVILSLFMGYCSYEMSKPSYDPTRVD